MLKVYLAGDLQLLRDDAPSSLVGEGALGGRQPRAALAFLVVNHRRTVLRDELGDLLWPDGLPAAWEVALRALVSKLRTALSPLTRVDEASPITMADGGGWRFAFPGPPWLDLEAAAAMVHDAEAALVAGDLDVAGGGSLAAATITARPFLAGIEGDWIDLQREALLETRIRALDVRSEVLMRTHQPDEARRDAERILVIDPYHERAIRRVMRAHAAAGDRARALRAFETFRSRLIAELGVEPADRTRHLLDAIVAGAMVMAEDVR
jgi:DNA-binding SARP family transcriptional activator